jgi:hypothetical protein
LGAVFFSCLKNDEICQERLGTDAKKNSNTGVIRFVSCSDAELVAMAKAMLWPL